MFLYAGERPDEETKQVLGVPTRTSCYFKLSDAFTLLRNEIICFGYVAKGEAQFGLQLLHFAC